MTTIDLTGYITESGELKANLPTGLPPGEVHITLTLPEANPGQLLNFQPVSGAEIVTAIRSGELDTSAWKDIPDSIAWAEDLRSREQDRLKW